MSETLRFTAPANPAAWARVGAALETGGPPGLVACAAAVEPDAGCCPALAGAAPLPPQPVRSTESPQIATTLAEITFI